METANINFYTIKQSNDTIWTFSFNEEDGIIYRCIKDNIWSEPKILAKEAYKNFSVILHSDDNICVIYEDLDKTIMLCKFDGEHWDNQGILTNKKNDNYDIFFKAISIEDNIHIIYKIFNKENNTATLLHQITNEKNGFSNTKIIDMIKYNYSFPFILCSQNNKELFIVYQRFINNHEIGYKLFNSDSQSWSKFNLIDRSINPFKDYSAIVYNNILHALYVRKEENFDGLYYMRGSNVGIKSKKLYNCSNIECCSILMVYDQIWCYGIDNNKIYISFSIDNGSNLSTPPYEQSLSPHKVFKTAYLSNEPNERKSMLGYEVYFINDEHLQFIPFQNFLSDNLILGKSKDYLSFLEYYMTEIQLKILSYEKIFKENEKIFAHSMQRLENKNLYALYYENKLLEIRKALEKYIDLKNQLHENIALLQKNLSDKEEKIRILESINLQKDNELISLKDKLSNSIHSLQENLNNKEKQINLIEQSKVEKENENNSLKMRLYQKENKVLYLLNDIKNLNNIIRSMYNNIYKQYNRNL